MNAMIHKRLKGQATNQVNEDDRTVVWVMSTGDVDRDGETVSPTGGDFSEYQLNRTVQWNHDTDSEPIGQLIGDPWNDYVGAGTKYAEVAGPKRMALLGRVKFDTDEQADRIYQKLKARLAEGNSMGGSISFVPTGRTEKNSDGGNHYPTWKLLEFTLCSVGSNPSAVATQKKHLKGAGVRLIKVGNGGAIRLTRKGARMRRKCWIHKTQKTGWLLKAEGGLDEETKDYLQMRGLDEVRIEDKEPPTDDWVADDGQQAPAEKARTVEQRDGHWFIMENGQVVNGPYDSMQAAQREMYKAMTGSQPPEGKTEDVADDVATAAMDLADKGVEPEMAVEAAMEDDGVPKSMRGAVKALALQKMKVRKDAPMTVEPEEAKGKKKGKKSVAPGRVCRAKSGTLVLVRGLKDKTATVVKVNGDEEEVKAKSLKRKADWPDMSDMGQPLTNWGGVGGKLTNWWGGVGDVANAVKAWYAKFIAKDVAMPALDDVDLTGAEKAEVEGAVDEAFMKAADDLEVSSIEEKGRGSQRWLEGYRAYRGMPPGMTRDDAPSPEWLEGWDAAAAGKSLKTADSIQPANDLPETPNTDPTTSPGAGSNPDMQGADPSTMMTKAMERGDTLKVVSGQHKGKTGTVTAKDANTVQLRLSNGNDIVVGKHEVMETKGLAFPRKQFKVWVKNLADGIAAKHSPKLRSTIAKRAAKFIRKALKAAPMSPDAACAKLMKEKDTLTSAERGMLGAACAQADKKLRKKFGACGGKKRCTKDFLCKKCVKAVLEKMPRSPQAKLKDAQPSAATNVDVRQCPDGTYELWSPSTGESLKGGFASYDEAAAALQQSVTGKSLKQTNICPNCDQKLSSSEVEWALKTGSCPKCQAYLKDDTQEKAGDTDTPGDAIPFTGSPTGGGTMELTAKTKADDDDDDPETKRAKSLLRRKSGEELDDGDWEALEKRLDAVIDGPLEQCSKRVYALTAKKI